MMRVAGVVLAGGRSRRFGRDKALALLGGQPLIHWSVEALRPETQVLAVNGPQALGERLHLPVVADFPGAASGPLAGILGAMAWADGQGCSHVITAPCDTPFLPPDMAARLIHAIQERPIAAARAARVHGLCAIWRVDGLEELARIASQVDQPPLQQVIEGLGGVLAPFPDEAAFANLNTEADFAAAEIRWVAEKRG